MKKLLEIQSELKAPKGQFNQFGKYKYRSCEDILELVKPLLKKHNCLLTISDEIVNIGERYYVKATARVGDLDTKLQDSVSITAYAREAESKKGMDESQITGACSSYARKYALNGLFAIDDTEDADVTNKHGKDVPRVKEEKKSVAAKTKTIDKENIEEMMEMCEDLKEVVDIWWKLTAEQQEDAEIQQWFKNRKLELGGR